jgi:hypothetical protein
MASFNEIMEDVANCDMDDLERSHLIEEIKEVMLSKGLKVSLGIIRHKCQKKLDTTMFNGWYFVMSNDRFYHSKLARSGISPDAFNRTYSNVSPNVANQVVALDLVEKMAYVVCIPFLPKIITDNTLNIWDRTTAPRNRAIKKVSLLLYKFFTLIYPKKDGIYLMDIFTELARHRDKRLGICPIIAGKIKGTGKSITTLIMSAIVGRDNFQPCTAQAVVQSSFSKFNNSSLVVFDDPKLLNMEDFWESMKTLITSNNVYDENKFETATKRINTRSFIITTNDIDKIYALLGDRRFCLFEPQIYCEDDKDMFVDVIDEVVKVIVIPLESIDDEVRKEIEDAIFAFFYNRKQVNKITIAEGKALLTESAKRYIKNPHTALGIMVVNNFKTGLYENNVSWESILFDAKRNHVRIPSNNYFNDDMQRADIKSKVELNEFNRKDVIYYTENCNEL